MAESQQERLREEVTCPLCLDIFKNPKRLPCDHVYCSQCLHSLILRSVGGTFTCPECRDNVPVPPNFDISTFSTPHQMNRLIEIHKANPKSTEALPSATPDPNTCTDHDSQPLALYCETCKSLVCRDCVILSCSKKNHKHGFIDDMAKKHHTILEEKLKPIREHHQVMSSALDDIATAERESQGRKEAKLLKVNTTFDTLHGILEQERNYFTKAIEDTFQKESDQNSAKREEISQVLLSLKSLILSVETAFVNEPRPVFLADVAKTEQSIKNMHYKVMKVSPHPVKLPEMEIELLSATNLKDLCQSKSFLYQNKDPLFKSHFNRLLDISTVPMYKPTEVTLHISPLGRRIKIDCQLHCSYDKLSQTVSIKQITPDQYSLSFRPQKRGKHELHIKCNGVHVCGSPIPVYVTIEPWEIMEISTPTIITRLHNPAGIKCYNDRIYVCEMDRGIAVLSSKDHKILRTIIFSGMGEVLITNNYFYITDTGEQRVIKMDRKTTIIVKSIGSEGDKPGQFNNPNGIRLSKDGEIYVCDSNNHRIQVLDQCLGLLRILGGQGNTCGKFYFPTDLEFDDNGDMYVVEQGNHRIQVLTPQGVHIRNIGRYGNSPGELSRPVSGAIHRNVVYITDRCNERISVFKTTGEFVTIFGKGTLSHLECIAIDDNGYIYVTNARSQLIVF